MYEFTPGHLAVTDGGDATGQELVRSHRQLAKVLFRLVLEMEVGAVMADLHSVDAGENVARGVGELTGEFAVFISGRTRHRPDSRCSRRYRACRR